MGRTTGKSIIPRKKIPNDGAAKGGEDTKLSTISDG